MLSGLCVAFVARAADRPILQSSWRMTACGGLGSGQLKQVFGDDVQLDLTGPAFD